MADRVKPLWNVDKKTTCSKTDEFLIVEEEEIKKIGIDDLINSNSNITKIKNDIKTVNSSVTNINNNINKKHNLNNLLKEARHFSTSVWTNIDEGNCILQNETYKDMTYYKCTKAYTSFRQNVSLKANTTYTFSYYIKGSRAGLNTMAFWNNLEGNNPDGQKTNNDVVKLDNTDWKRVVVTGINVVEDFVGCFRVEPCELKDGDYIYVCGLCLLEGNCFDNGFVENVNDQNWKYLSSGTDIVLQPDGRYCGTSLYHAPPTQFTDVAFYYEMTTYGRNSKYKKLHAWNATYNIEYTATMNNGSWSSWSVVHKEDEVFNFNLTSAPSTNVINISSLYCNNSIDLHFIASGVTGGNGNPTCSFYFWYDDNGTNKQGNIAFQLPVNVDNSNKAPVSLKVKLVKMNDNTWMVNLDCIRNGSGYNTFSKCILVTGTNIKIKTCNISTNNQNIKFETPCLIVKYN